MLAALCAFCNDLVNGAARRRTAKERREIARVQLSKTHARFADHDVAREDHYSRPKRGKVVIDNS